MSKGNMLLGHARGKLGDLVFYRANGNQVTRAKAASVKNPKTTLQTIQRMIFGTVSEAYKRMKSICDHSFEGVQYGQKSMSKFMSENLKRLRAYYPTSADPSAYAEIDPVNGMAFALKGNGASAGTGLIIAMGSVPSVPIVTTAAGVFDGFGEEFNSAPTIQDVMDALNARVGDQITLCALVDLGTGYEFQKSRYVINADATAEQLAVAWDKTGAADAFDPVKTQVGILQLNCAANSQAVPETSVGDIVAVGCILSRKSESGAWLRSNTIMYNTTDEVPEYQVEYALPTWEDASTVIDAESQRYLNNAELGK